MISEHGTLTIRYTRVLAAVKHYHVMRQCYKDIDRTANDTQLKIRTVQQHIQITVCIHIHGNKAVIDIAVNSSRVQNAST